MRKSSRPTRCILSSDLSASSRACEITFWKPANSGSAKLTRATFPIFSSRPVESARTIGPSRRFPNDLCDRRVEITGPTDRKMIINALNSGANVYMADFEDSNSPTWHNLVDGQRNLCDAVDGTIDFTSPEGKQYRLNAQTATLMVRPRGLHLPEKHVWFGGRPVPGCAVRFRLVLLPQRPEAAGQGQRPVLLSSQAGKPPRSAVVERSVPHGARRTGHPPRQHPRHGADRDDSRRLRDGRNPVRASRTIRRG